MKKCLTMISIMFLPVILMAQLTTEWERCTRTGAVEGIPDWFTSGYVRGMALSDSQIYVADRANTLIRVMNALNGSDVTLDTDFDLNQSAGGTYVMNDIETSEDGYIFLGNLSLDAQTDTFKIYVWNSVGGPPDETIKLAGKTAERLGDKFLVTGSVTDNTIEIWVPVATSNPGKIYKITSGNQGASWDTTSIVLTGAYVNLPSNATVAPLGTGAEKFYVTGNGANPRGHTTTGAYVTSSLFDTQKFTSSRNGLRYFTNGSQDWLAIYTYVDDGSSVANKTGRVIVYDVTDSANPIIITNSPLLGDDIDTFSSIHGECLIRDNQDSTYTIFVLDGSNGFGAYTTEEPTPQVTIYEIQYPSDETGDSPFKGQVVTTRATITAVVPENGFFLQDSASAWNGLWVSFPDHDLSIGDNVIITGFVNEDSGMTELKDITSNVLISSDNELPSPIVLATSACNDEAYEGVLVQTVGICTNDSLGSGEWQIDDDSGPVRIDDGIFVFTPVQGKMYQVSGPLSDSSGIYKVQPRDAYDIIDMSQISLPLLEGATGGTFDLDWRFNTSVMSAGDSIYIIDSTSSDWGSHIIAFRNTDNTGLIYIKDALLTNYSVEADIFLVGEPDPDFSLYTGIGIKMSDNDMAFYRLVYRNSTSTDHGQLRLQGYDGANWHISQYWDAGVDFDSLETGWHKFRVTVIGNLFWAFMDDQLLPGCPYSDNSPFLTEGYPGIYTFSTPGTVLFDNFQVTEPNIPEPSEAEPLVPFWALTQTAGTFPDYMSAASTERGMAYGNVSGKDRIYVVTRNAGPKIVVHDAITGDRVNTIPFTEPTNAFFPINAVDVSDDGVIFVCNGIPFGLSSSNPFKVYRYDNEDATPVTVLEYSEISGRYGDMFSVYGRTDDNSVTIFAALKDDKRFIKFTTADNGMTFTPQVITLSDGDGFGTNPNVVELPDGTLYIKSYGKPLVHIQADGTVIDSVAGEIVSTAAGKIKYFNDNNKDLIIAHYANVGGGQGSALFDIVDVTLGAKNAYRLRYSGSIGDVTNSNAAGSVDFMPLGNTEFIFFMLETNNGLAAFATNNSIVEVNSDILFHGDTPTLLENPFGWGYIAGTNEYEDIGKYERFDFNAGDVIHGFRYYFAALKIVDDPDTLHLVVKTLGANGAPDSTLATVMTTTDKITVGTSGNYFYLDSPMKVSGPVFVGFEWGEWGTIANDTIALYTDTDGEGDNENRAWEKLSDNSYNDFQTVLNPDFSWLIDVDFWIAVYYKKAAASSLEELVKNGAPHDYELSQNYPNPFNPTTRFHLKLPGQSKVSITVYDILGQKVEELFNGKLPGGKHEFIFNGNRYASGVYFYQLVAGDFIQVRKMILLR